MMWSTPMRSRSLRHDGSSMVQNQKLRCITSAGEGSIPSHVPYICWYLATWSRRSSRPGTQAMPPSDMAILMFGNRTGILEYRKSTAENMAYPKNSTPMVSGGASGAVDGDDDDDPTCRQTTVPVSSHACITGSQCPVCSDGRPSFSGASLNDTATNPRSALRRISSAASTGSNIHGSWHGMMRVGYFEYPSSNSQSFHARTHAS